MDINLENFDFGIIITTLFFTLFLIPLINIISNHITKLGTYHNNESFWNQRLYKLYQTYLVLSIPLILTILVLLAQNIGTDNPYKIAFLSFRTSSMIPLIGRVCAISNRELFDNDPIREKERILSLIFSIIVSTLIIFMLVIIYHLAFYKSLFNLNISGTYSNAIILIVAFFLLPFFTSLIGEGILYCKGVCSKVKI